MPQSFARLYVHMVFSTKYRQRSIGDDVRNELHAFIIAILEGLGCTSIFLNSVEDHVHLLFDLGRTASVSTVAEEVKRKSSRWIKTKAPELAEFAWQTGYSAFSVSSSKVPVVRRYIAGQREHHRRLAFDEEIRTLLGRHGIDVDERQLRD